MKGWKKDIFNNFIKLNRGFDLPNQSIKIGNYPVVASTSVKAYHNAYKVEPSCVVTGRSGSLGSVQYVNEKCWPLNTTLYVKDYKGNLPAYVYYFLQTMHLENFNAGAGVPTLNQNHLHKLKISIPPLPIQKKIAAVLSAYDDLIENNNRRIAIVEKMAEEIYREWFVRMRFSGHEKVKFHKGVPEGWEETKIEKLCDEKRIGIKLKNVEYNTKYIGLEHLPRRSISIKDSDTVESIQSDKLLFKDRDILFCKIRPYLHKVALAHFSGACSTDTIIIRPRKVEYEGLILFTVFSTTFIELATASAKGTKMPRADWDFLKQLEILLPSKNILATFQTQLDSYFALICNYLSANERLKQSRDRLLSRLLSGKLSVENLDIKFPPGMEETDA